MKHPYLCVCLTLALSITVFQPTVRLDAAELWNSQNRSSSRIVPYIANRGGETGSYHNRSGRSFEGGTLYNSRNPASRRSGTGLRVSSLTRERTSYGLREMQMPAHWSSLPVHALAHRKAITQCILEKDRDLREGSARVMAEMRQNSQKNLAREEQKYLKKLAAFRAERAEYSKLKRVALGKVSQEHRPSRNVYRSYTARSDSSARGGLKKPVRLFNDPND
ncbi:MAG: hypothetical protein ACLFU1_03610 [Alphaproteobacteria bacterium]